MKGDDKINWYVTGDKHQNIAELEKTIKGIEEPSNIIILGDASFNYYLSKKDLPFKECAQNSKHTFYVVAGNHECTNFEQLGFSAEYDKNVEGVVFIEKDFPNIRYFKRYGIYQLGKYKCAVIGGAYSVDKFYRLQNKWTWFADEQLTAKEREECGKLLAGTKIDFVFSHTCPQSWEPTELFLSMIDQSQVDKTTEIWMDELKDTFTWKQWVWGHFHADMLVRPHAEMFYTDVESLDSIAQRWEVYDETGELDWWLLKSRDFYIE